ncbi:MAG TPA: lamin tail domain-containing protein, partial [Pyrinomonadaceae bacterium]|nr:lamin tail domain-containing protein [Pyrinomonadaceae bacterium]
MPPHARKLILVACCALALVCADSRVRSQGTMVRRVTVTPENATSLNPTLSGDGRRLVFESTANLSGDAGGSRFRAFTADTASDPPAFSTLAASRAPAAAVSQDGSSVAFASAEDLTGENADRNSEIFLSAAGRLAQLTHTSPGDPSARARDGNFQPSISDDGHVIAFASNRDLTGENPDGNSEIFTYDAANGRLTQLTNSSGTTGARDAKLSGDGSSVAFVRDDAPAGASTPRLDLVLFRSGAKSFTTLAENVARLALGPARAVSDDGARVVYSAETAANTTQVFLYDGRNNATRQLTHLGSRATDVPLNPTISGDGSRVVFATRRSVGGGGSNSDGGVELYLYDLPTNQLSRLTDAPAAATAEVVASLDDAGSLVAFNFPRVIAAAVSSEEFANDSEIFLAAPAARAPFSSDLKFRHGAIPNRDLAAAQPLAPGQIAIARGANLALVTAQAGRLADGTFPRSFKNCSVAVDGRAAQILFVSPAQVNFQIPDETQTGAAEIVVTNHDGYESRSLAQIASVAPGVFTERGDGTGAAVALDTATQTRAPFDPRDGANGPRRVTLFATGVRHAETLSVTMAGRELQIESRIPSPDLPGLDEIRVRLPLALAGAGVVPLSLTADGRTSNRSSIELAGARRAARISLSPADATLGVGRSLHYDATVFDEEGEEIAGARVDFNSDDAGVASVDPDGRAHALREGETRIRASAGEVTAEATLRCRALSLVVNEVLADPPDGAVGDANRDGQRSASQDEFVEIVNASDGDIDLGGYRVATRDAGGAQIIRHTFAPGFVLPPGTAAVVFGGANAATFNPHDAAFAGAQVFLASAGGLSLLNGGHTVVLLDASSRIVEEMSYGDSTDLEGDRNQSLTRSPDVTGDFALHQTVAVARGRPFSPGVKADGAPFQTSAPVARVEVEPARCDAQVGATCRFTARAFDGAGRELRGVIFDWQTGDTTIATIDRIGVARALRLGVTGITAGARGTRSAPAPLSVVPPPRRVFRVVVTPSTSAVNRGGTVQFTARAFDQTGGIVPDASFAWVSDAAAVATVDASGVARGAGVGVVNLTATTGDGAGGTVSAGAMLEVRLPVIISEVLADVPPDDAATAAVEGDANRDGVRNSGDDEFIELFNPSDDAVDLSGVRLADATTDRFTFPAATTLEAGRALVVFGGGKPPASDPAFGASLVRVASSLSLNDGGDTVSLKLKVGAQEITLASLAYGAPGATPAPADQSLTRERDAAGGLGAGLVAHLSASDSAARAFSPGTLPDGTPFGSARITRIEIAPPSASIDIGASQVFTARAFAGGGAGEIEIENVSFAWDVSVPAGASPAPTSGATTSVTAHASGGFTVRARAGGREAVAALTVNPPPPILTRVELSPTSATIFVGGAQQFTARAFDQFDRPYAGARITFSSSEADIAAVGEGAPGTGDGSATASVAGLRAGAALIVASANDGARNVASGGAMLQVVQPPPVVARVVVSPAETSVNRGQARQFTAQAFDQNDQPVADALFDWATSDSHAATVSSDGMARGVGIGTVNIIATTPSGGRTISGQAALTVRAPLVINEILADVPPDNAGTANVEGDANRDGARNSDDDEFVELFNNSSAALDLSGVVVADSSSNRFTFPAGTTLAAGQAVVIFGGGSPAAHDPVFGGALVFTTSSLGLNDGGDTVNVKLPSPGGDTLIATQSYGGAAVGTPAAPADQSLARAPDAEVGGAGGVFIAHGAAARA